MSRTVVTIGVYGWTLAGFLDALLAADVVLLVDVRQRRGVRGSEYAWANAQRLQRALAAAGVAYSHHKELAPTTELRHLQYREDDRLGVGKRSRVALAPALPARDPRPGRPRAARRRDAAAPRDGALLRRTRPRGVSPVSRGQATRGGARLQGRAPAPAAVSGATAPTRRGYAARRFP